MSLPPVPREQPFLLQGINKPSMPWMYWFEKISIDAGESTSGITVHSELTGLDADDHPQYLLTNGGRQLSGNWDAGGVFDIRNVANLTITAGGYVSSEVDDQAIYISGGTIGLGGAIRLTGGTTAGEADSVGIYAGAQASILVSPDYGIEAYQDVTITDSKNILFGVGSNIFKTTAGRELSINSGIVGGSANSVVINLIDANVDEEQSCELNVNLEGERIFHIYDSRIWFQTNLIVQDSSELRIDYGCSLTGDTNTTINFNDLFTVNSTNGNTFIGGSLTGTSTGTIDFSSFFVDAFTGYVDGRKFIANNEALTEYIQMYVDGSNNGAFETLSGSILFRPSGTTKATLSASDFDVETNLNVNGIIAVTGSGAHDIFVDNLEDYGFKLSATGYDFLKCYDGGAVGDSSIEFDVGIICTSIVSTGLTVYGLSTDSAHIQLMKNQQITVTEDISWIAFGAIGAGGSEEGARIVAIGDGTWATNDSPTYMEFQLDNSGTMTAYMTLKKTDVSFVGDVNIATTGKGLGIKTGAATDDMGTATLVAGTVTVSHTGIASTDKIFLNQATTGGTLGILTYTITASTSFTITSTSVLDTSTVNYLIIRAL